MATTHLEGLAEPGHEILHHAAGSDAEDSWVHTVRVLFSDREHAEDAITELLRHTPLPSSSISIAPAEGLRAPCCDPRPRSARKAAGRGGTLGALVGAAVGVAFALAGMVDMDLIAAIPLLALAWAGFGTVSGALIGLAVTDPMDDDPLEEVVGPPGSVVVTIRSLKADRIRERLARLGGTPVDTHPPVPTDGAPPSVSDRPAEPGAY